MSTTERFSAIRSVLGLRLEIERMQRELLQSRRHIMREIREFREERGFSYRELGDRLGVSHTAVRLWEDGKAVPDADNIEAIFHLISEAPDDQD